MFLKTVNSTSVNSTNKKEKRKRKKRGGRKTPRPMCLNNKNTKYYINQL
jgi:hypothetical protein